MRQVYNWENNTIHFKDKNENVFHIQLRGRITIVTGDSATGKTLLCSRLNSVKHDRNINAQRYKADNVFILNEDNIDKLKSQRNKLIIIDRAEILLDDDMVLYINEDPGNRYLIFARKPIGIEATPNHFAEMQFVDGEIILHFEFDVEGWC